MQGEEVVFLAVEGGDVVGRLRHEVKEEGQGAMEQEAILQFREKTNEIYVPN
jgi:hypothetical protein